MMGLFMHNCQVNDFIIYAFIFLSVFPVIEIWIHIYLFALEWKYLWKHIC